MKSIAKSFHDYQRSTSWKNERFNKIFEYLNQENERWTDIGNIAMKLPELFNGDDTEIVPSLINE